jgi:putative ABC transport system permease protein
LLANPNIASASTSSSIPGKGFGKNVIGIESEEGSMEQKGVDHYNVDYDYFSTLKIDFDKGRNFSMEFGSDSSAAVIVNEAMVKRMGWSEPIGKKFKLSPNDSLAFWKVIGVTKDFHQQSLYNPIEPLMFMPSLNNKSVLVKIENDLEGSMKSIEKSWQEVFPTIPFEYSFVDEAFLEQYETDQLRGNLFLGFSFITIIITCLGLMGLASYTTEQRTKEISIRKVLGAKTTGLVSLLVKDFIYLIGIGAVPAFVAAWFLMNEWLSSFEYHIEIGYFIFVLVLISILIITVGTTGYFALKAANSNPAEKLKYE